MQGLLPKSQITQENQESLALHRQKLPHATADRRAPLLYLVRGICYPTRPGEGGISWSIAVITLYGIKNCDTVRKARKWLDAHAIDYDYHDFREDGLERSAVENWIEQLGWETVVNRRSTSWKALDVSEREAMNKQSAVIAVLSHPTLIKRPLLNTGKQYFAGFSPTNYEKIFKSHTL